MNRSGLALLSILCLAVPLGWAAETSPLKTSATDKCPVCGMFVAKYPDFLAGILFNDGSRTVFDGAKDMFKYYFDMKKYERTKGPEDIKSIQVTDYYRLSSVDGYKAFYVLGSDVYGPMGRELIPFEREAEAREFMQDHKGKSILRFADITTDTIRSMD